MSIFYVNFIIPPYLCLMILRIKEILREKGLTNRDFARLMGKKPQYTCSVANGSIGVSLKMLSRMAEVLDVPLKELFY